MTLSEYEKVGDRKVAVLQQVDNAAYILTTEQLEKYREDKEW